MADQKLNVEHVDDSAHEAELSGALALGALFSTCVEAFGLIQPPAKYDRRVQQLLVRLGLQQARLLIWGFVVGVTSPPASVTTGAVPRHPSWTYPDTKEPTFFGARDPRLDEPALRTRIEAALAEIIDRTSYSSREDMMAKFGLKHPKKHHTPHVDVALDGTRLEAFRERYALLQEVAETYANISVGRNNSMIQSPWQVVDGGKFAHYLALVQEKVDSLVDMTHSKEAVDRAMCMDIRSFGWHVVPDRPRLAMDISKLRLLEEVCRDDYPQYIPAIEQAQENIDRENEEFSIVVGPGMHARSRSADASINSSSHSTSHTTKDGHLHPPTSSHHKTKRPSLMKLFKSFGRSREKVPTNGSPKVSDSESSSVAPSRTHSESGPSGPPQDATVSAIDHAADVDADTAPLGRTRSKSVGALPEDATAEELSRLQLQSIPTIVEGEILDDDEIQAHKAQQQQQQRPYEVGPMVQGAPGPVRHDQYRGIARVNTQDLHQGDY